MTEGLIPVPALPVKGPQLSLLSSSVAPSAETNEWTLGEDVIALLPDELKVELAAREGEAWTRGFAYQPEPFAAATVRARADVTTVLPTNVVTAATIVEFIPYLIETPYSASSFGFPEIDFVGLARRANDLAAPEAIEREFAEGAIAIANSFPNNYLTNITVAANNLTPGSTTINNGTAVSVTEGIGILQDALRTGPGGQGMIHVTPRSTPSLLNVRRVGKYLLDIFDNIVVPGTGYRGYGPGNVAPAAGTSWLYATDLVMTRIEREATVFPDSMAEALDRGQNGQPNQFNWYASRFAAAYFDGRRQFACLVNDPT